MKVPFRVSIQFNKQSTSFTVFDTVAIEPRRHELIVFPIKGASTSVRNLSHYLGGSANALFVLESIVVGSIDEFNRITVEFAKNYEIEQIEHFDSSVNPLYDALCFHLKISTSDSLVKFEPTTSNSIGKIFQAIFLSQKFPSGAISPDAIGYSAGIVKELHNIILNNRDLRRDGLFDLKEVVEDIQIFLKSDAIGITEWDNSPERVTEILAGLNAKL